MGRAWKVCPGYPIKTNPAETWHYLPYVLNPLNPLRLLHKMTTSVQIDNININSKLQHILQNCNFIEDIILLVSAQLCIADLASAVF